RVVDALRAHWNLGGMRNEFGGQFVKGHWQAHALALLKPMTFMNRSGEAAQQALQFYKLNLESLLCVHDELDLPFGTVRVKIGGGPAGHNGINSMVNHCGDGFLRLRIGIGRPPAGAAESYVLSPFNSEENLGLASVLQTAVDFTEAIIQNGATAAMN